MFSRDDQNLVQIVQCLVAVLNLAISNQVPLNRKRYPHPFPFQPLCQNADTLEGSILVASPIPVPAYPLSAQIDHE
jgi:hypothetical protein